MTLIEKRLFKAVFSCHNYPYLSIHSPLFEFFILFGTLEYFFSRGQKMSFGSIDKNEFEVQSQYSL